MLFALLLVVSLTALGQLTTADILGTITDANEARTGSRPVHFGEGFTDVTTYNGASLGAGAVVEGPALIEEPFTVVVLAPGDVARLDQHGNYDIAIGS